MKYKSIGDFHVDAQDVSTMPQYPQQLHWLKLYARSIPRRYYWLLFFSTLLSTLFFSFVVRSNSRSVHALLTSFFSSSSPVANGNPSPLAPSQTLSIYDQSIIYTDYNYLDNSTLTFEKRTYGDQAPVFFRLPKKAPIWALLLIFHGCSRSAYDWFSTIERQRIVGAAIDLGYGCIAFQSTDDFSRCWSSELDFTNNPDAQMVWSTLDGFYKEHPKLKSLPRFTFGASSGGMFSSVFATNSKYAVQGQIIFISVVRPDLLQTHVKAGKYPSTAWIYMTGDTEFASEVRINDSMKVFAEQNIPHIAYAIRPLSVTPTTFHERIPTITQETSAAILHALREHSWLDSQSHLKSNPRRTNTWPDFLSAVVNKTITSTRVLDNLERHRTVLPDFLNTIYGQHEISFERSFEALQWHKQIWNKNSHSAMSPST